MILKFMMKALVLTMVGFAFTGTAAWAQQYLITTVAGGGIPPTGLPAVNAPLPNTQAVAVDAHGNMYFIAGNWVFKVDAAGTLTRVAGTRGGGYSGDGGPATSAQLGGPGGVAVDAAGNLYIADAGNNAIRKVAAATGIITTVAGNGTEGYKGDGGPATSAQLAGPFGVAVDAAGNFYFADAGNLVIRKVAAATGIITTVAGNGTSGYTGDGAPATSAQFKAPEGLAVDAAGNLYITDRLCDAVRKVAAATGIITTVAGTGSYGYSGDNGPAASAQLYGPRGAAVDAAGNLYIADTYNNRIRMVAAATGTITTVAGNGGYGGYSGDGGLATGAQLHYPYSAAVDPAGNLYIADALNSRIRMVAAATGTITTVAGNGGSVSSGDGGPATSAELNQPNAAVVDAAGNLYIADTMNNVIRKVAAATGIITTVAGNGTAGYSGDNGPATKCQLNMPESVAVDGAGNLYISDYGNSVIRKVVGGTITTVAGNGTPCYWGDGGPATSARLYYPLGIALDTAGNLYIADYLNYRVREVVAATGAIQTVAGNGAIGYSGDGGPATAAKINAPYAVAVDGAGNLYIAEQQSGVIRKVSASGTITTVAGNGSLGISGDGGPATKAQLLLPGGVAVDAAGSLYIADTYGGSIRKVANGTITSVAGNHTFGYSGDGGPATSAQLNQAGGVAVDAAGNVYIADTYNNAIRLLFPLGTRALLSVTATHSGDFAPGQVGATYSVVVSNAVLAGPTSGTVTVTEIVPTGLTLASMAGTGWSCSGSACTRSDALNPGSNQPPVTVSYPPITVTVNVAADAPAQVIDEVSVKGGGSAASGAADTTNIENIVLPEAPVLSSPGNEATGVVVAPALAWNASSGVASYDVYFGASSTPPMVGNTTDTNYAPGTLSSGTTYYWQVVARNAGGTASSAIWSFTTTTGGPAVGLQFVPVTPCRIADTRNANGPFGGPTMTGSSTRSFAVPQSTCAIPATALAYSLNVTVVPEGPLSYLSLWPTGQSQPLVSTLNSPAGQVVANAAIVPAGTGGAVSVFVTDPTDVILDINGYFAASTSGAFSFYPAPPCRVADTRNATGTFGGPSMYAGQVRDFPIPLSTCEIPATAGAYALNVTVVPAGGLGYLTTWPTGKPQPNASTLNLETGKIVANAALVPAGTNESISVYVTNPTDVILD
ncbi:MAG TPA: NHL repeat-containing protein, partial [Bryobacteraceae bacterium]